MNYDKINKIDTDGSGNLILQDISGSTITVNYNDTAEFSRLLNMVSEDLLDTIQKKIKTQNTDFELLIQKYLALPPEVKTRKRELLNRLNHLSEILETLQKEAEQAQTIPDNEEEDFFGDDEWEFLIDAIKEGGCILFIGQEISIDENGKSLHETFYKKLEKQFSVEYLADEGFFAPADNDMIKYKVKKYYRETFHKHNQHGYQLLSKLAEIPFSLILSLTPDNTMRRIFENFQKKHQYLYYEKNTQPATEKPTRENPLLYNILGEAEKYEYIFTHEQFYEYIRNIHLTPEIKDKLQDATHFLFLGFDFNKWYNRLLLFFLNLSERKTKPFANAFEEKMIEPRFKDFIKKQFNITYINDHYKVFVNQLWQKTRHENINTNLRQHFVSRNTEKAKQLRDRTIDANSLEKLAEIKAQVDELEKTLTNFKPK